MLFRRLVKGKVKWSTLFSKEDKKDAPNKILSSCYSRVEKKYLTTYLSAIMRADV